MVLLFLNLPTLGFAQFTWTTNEDTITITGYTGSGGNVTIPSVITGLPVTAIGANAFWGRTNVTDVTLPNSITLVAYGGFSYCGNLTNVNLGAGVLEIQTHAFGSCSNLTSIAIPASTISIDLNAFESSTRLSEINVATLNSDYSSLDGVLFDKSQATLILYPEGKFVPNYIVPTGVTNIGPRAFSLRANLTGITLPETLTSVGDWAFRGCGLTRLVLPNSLTNIQDASYISIGGPFGVFNWCTSLTNVIFGKDLAYLGTGAFTFCENLTAVFFQGNAPATAGTNGGPIPGPWIFLNAPLVTVYYLPGTTGWEPTFSQRSTMLWNPQIQTSDGSFGVGPTGFGFNVVGTPDIPIVIEAGTDLAAQSWVPQQSCTLTNGLIHFNDAQWANFPSRYYRVRSP